MLVDGSDEDVDQTLTYSIGSVKLSVSKRYDPAQGFQIELDGCDPGDVPTGGDPRTGACGCGCCIARRTLYCAASVAVRGPQSTR